MLANGDLLTVPRVRRGVRVLAGAAIYWMGPMQPSRLLQQSGIRVINGGGNTSVLVCAMVGELHSARSAWTVFLKVYAPALTTLGMGMPPLPLSTDWRNLLPFQCLLAGIRELGG